MRIPDFIIFDFETLSTDTTTAPIISMGAICGKWGDEVDDIRQNSFYRNVRIDEQLHLGLKPMKSTLEWWSKQSAEAKLVFNAKDKVSLQTCLDDFRDWCKLNNVTHDTTVWIRAPHFDFNIITNLYTRIYGKDRCEEMMPISHWRVRDTRTFNDIAWGVKNGYHPARHEIFSHFDIVEHNAVDDCIKEYLQMVLFFGEES